MGSVRFAGHSILIVEDEPLITLELRQLCETTGAYVFAATQFAHALSLAEHPDLSIALLDYRIGDHTSEAICRRLHERGIPFLFYSGYDEMRGEWPDAIILSKPAQGEAVIEALARLLNHRHDQRPIAPFEAQQELRTT
jgi:DNA-binding response OmpR family regulator